MMKLWCENDGVITVCKWCSVDLWTIKNIKEKKQFTGKNKWFETVSMCSLSTSWDGWHNLFWEIHNHFHLPRMYYICCFQSQLLLTEVWIPPTLYSTVRFRYNAVNFLTNIHKRHPRASPLGRGMGCVFWIRRSSSVPVIIYVTSNNIGPR